MRFRIAQLWIAGRRGRAGKLVLRTACWCCLTLAILAPDLGCSKSKRSVEHAEVSGKVSYKGRPVTGGRVSFVAVDGGFAVVETIEENGDYKISSPVGEVLIGVDNRMLRGGKQNTPHLKRPGTEEKPVKGKYVPLPDRCWDPDRSGLKYTVKPGAQTFNIEITD